MSRRLFSVVATFSLPTYRGLSGVVSWLNSLPASRDLFAGSRDFSKKKDRLDTADKSRVCYNAEQVAVRRDEVYHIIVFILTRILHLGSSRSPVSLSLIVCTRAVNK